MTGAAPGVTVAAPRPAPAAQTSEPGYGLRHEEGEIVRLYRALLDRSPDPTGFDYWVALRIEGVPLAVVADSFLVGREFEIRFDADTDAAFVELLYRTVLGRQSDVQGAAYWRGQLADGLTRAELVLLFSESVEFQAITGTARLALPSIEATDRAVTATELAASWEVGCPVAPEDLRAVTFDHVDFEGRHQRGVLIVHGDVVEEVIAVFAALYRDRYPIDSIRPVHEFGGDDDASMAANNTSAFNCRRITGGRGWSHHAYGTAIDVNPIHNPYVATEVLPPAGEAYVDRSHYHPAMIRPGDVVTRAFADIGWTWGGDFRSLRDYQHFER